MIHYVVMLYRRPELSQEQFESAWIGEHLQLARALPGLVAAEFLPRAQTGHGDTGPHGVGRLIFESVQSLEFALGTPAAAELREHTATFADSDAAIRMIAREP